MSDARLSERCNLDSLDREKWRASYARRILTRRRNSRHRCAEGCGHMAVPGRLRCRDCQRERERDWNRSAWLKRKGQLVSAAIVRPDGWCWQTAPRDPRFGELDGRIKTGPQPMLWRGDLVAGVGRKAGAA